MLCRMDSLTQAVLGAAVGQAGLGRSLGRRAIVWGAVLGTLPDLDVIAHPFLDTIAQLEWHRGISHSLLGIALASPLLGWLVHRMHRTVPFARAAITVWWIFFTHVLIDVFTVYGTMVFAPFSDARIGFNNLFIIDPLFTLPLCVGVVAAWILRKQQDTAMQWNAVGLSLAVGYVVWSLGVKTWADHRLANALKGQAIPAVRHMTSPTPFNTILWRCLADDGTRLHIAYVSVLNPTAPVRFTSLPKNAELARPGRISDRLRWFSNDYCSIDPLAEGLRYNDWRFGEVPAATQQARPVFSWLASNDGNVSPLRPGFTAESLDAILQLMFEPDREPR